MYEFCNRKNTWIAHLMSVLTNIMYAFGLILVNVPFLLLFVYSSLSMATMPLLCPATSYQVLYHDNV